MVFEEKTMRCERIYEGKILNLKIETVELPNKKYSKREIIEHPNGVAIIAIVEESLVMVKQYRKAVDRAMLELPAGLLEVNEEPKEAALRELKEETGYESEKIEYVMEFYTSPGYCNEKIYLFLATDLREGVAMPEPDESVVHEKYPIEDLVKMVSRGEILDSKTIIGINIAQNYLLSK